MTWRRKVHTMRLTLLYVAIPTTMAMTPSRGLATRGSALFSALQPSTPLATRMTEESVRNSVRLEKPLGLVLEEIEAGQPGARVKQVKAQSSSSGRVAVGSELIAIDGVPVSSLPFSMIVDSMARAGTTVEMTFGPPSWDLPRASQSGLPQSPALPWMPCPAVLAAELAAKHAGLAGNAGFDPLGLATDRRRLRVLRDAEVKHARLAMMAAAGWPLAELWDAPLAQAWGLPSVLAQNHGLNPSLLNGGMLSTVSVWWWVAVLAFSSWVEGQGAVAAGKATVTNKPWLPGDLGFDPLRLYPTNAADKFRMQTAEIKNGRVAMLAVTAFALEEAITHLPATTWL